MTLHSETIAKTEMTPRAPVAILREKAEWFGAITNGEVVAEITQVEDFDNGGKRFFWKLKLRAPDLGRYRYQLLSVEYGIDPYPLKLYADEDALTEVCDETSEVFGNGELLDPQNPEKLKASSKPFLRVLYGLVEKPQMLWIESEDEFIGALEKIFNTKRVAKVINAIRAQIAA